MMSGQFTKKKAMVSWTGGKDCALSLFITRQSGFEISGLVTFITEGSNFRAHPLNVIEKQAEALNLPGQRWLLKNPIRSFMKSLLKKLNGCMI
jgi:diphthamide synthase (EF-2-diphthine--ammonia ligase)